MLLQFVVNLIKTVNYSFVHPYFNVNRADSGIMVICPNKGNDELLVLPFNMASHIKHITSACWNLFDLHKMHHYILYVDVANEHKLYVFCLCKLCYFTFQKYTKGYSISENICSICTRMYT